MQKISNGELSINDSIIIEFTHYGKVVDVSKWVCMWERDKQFDIFVI